MRNRFQEWRRPTTWPYWASASEIPGGPPFENFEIVEPFRRGAAFRFAVDGLD